MIDIKTPEDVELIRISGRLASQTLDYLKQYIKPGVATEKLDQLGHEFILDHGATPSSLGYRGYPKSLCASINDEVVHGIPGKTRLKDGDIVTVDITVHKNGFHGDTARSFAVGTISERARKLIKITEEAMYLGIEACRAGNHLGDIGAATQKHVEAAGFSVVRAFVGHGIGREFHEDPKVPFYGRAGLGKKLKEGMIITIEPMINEGTWEVEILDDGWTAITKDGLLSAQFEHTVSITNNGPDILTLS